MSWILRLLHHLRAAFRSLPLETAAIAGSVAGFWWLVHSDGDKDAARCFFAAVLAVPLFYAVTLLRRSGRIRPAHAHILAGLAAAAAIGLGGTGLEHEDAFAWRFGLAALAAVMLPFIAAAVAARGERLVGFSDFVRRFSEETTASALLCGAAIVALVVLVGSTQALFGVSRIAGVQIDRLGVDAVAAVIALCALAYLHRLLPGSGPARVPELWRRLIARVAAPFLVAMLGLLAVYEIWVIARGQLPANLISPLIVAAGAIGFASTLVIESLVAVREQRALSPADPHPWTAAGPVRLSRAFAAILLALLPLAMWALWVRVDQHGLTPMRAARMYALACLGLLALWGTLRWLRRRPPLTWEIPLCTAMVALVASVGPASVVELSIRSQAARLEQTLVEFGVSTALPATPPGTSPIQFPEDDLHELGDRITTLVELGGADALSRALTGNLAPCASRWNLDLCQEYLGIGVAHGVSEVYLASTTDASVAGFHIVETRALHSPVHHAALGDISISLTATQLAVHRDGKIWLTADLGPIERWTETRTVGPIPPLVDAAGCTRAHALARSGVASRTPEGLKIDELALLLLVPIEPDCPAPPR